MISAFFKKRHRILLVLAACAVAALVLYQVVQSEPEPQYNGKKSSQWAEIYEMSLNPTTVDAEPPPDSAERREAVEAVRRMKDKVLPRAVRMITYQKPAWMSRVENFMEMRLNVRRWCPLFIWGPFYGDRGEDNMVYFQMLGPEASPALPELVRIMNHAKAVRSRERAMSALVCIGEDGLRPLMDVAGDPLNPDRRRAAFEILSMKPLGTKLSPAVPLLVKALKDEDVNVSTAAAMILGELALDADIAVPALTNCLQSADWHLRVEAAGALGKFGDGARPAVPALLEALSDSDDSVRYEATNALVRISPQSLPKSAEEELTTK